jgi:ATP-dependent protease HslVU (ClpYQ) peptidase subunit
MREVYQFARYWAIGSGRKFAMGAMHALFDTDMTAGQIAEAAIRAGCEFDASSSLPLTIHTIQKEKDTRS